MTTNSLQEEVVVASLLVDVGETTLRHVVEEEASRLAELEIALVLVIRERISAKKTTTRKRKLVSA